MYQLTRLTSKMPPHMIQKECSLTTASCSLSLSMTVILSRREGLQGWDRRRPVLPRERRRLVLRQRAEPQAFPRREVSPQLADWLGHRRAAELPLRARRLEQLQGPGPQARPEQRPRRP